MTAWLTNYSDNADGAAEGIIRFSEEQLIVALLAGRQFFSMEPQGVPD